MPIEFEGTDDQRIRFAATTPIDNLTTYTLMARINAAAIAHGTAPRIFDKNGLLGATGWNLGLQDEATGSGRENNVFFLAVWSGAVGIWETATNTITPGTEYHIGLTYDNGATANNPLCYINGVSSALTEISTPVGAIQSDAGNALLLGDTDRSDAGAQPFNGYQSDYRIYNRVVSATDTKSIVDSNSISPNGHRQGLVFHVPGIGASGLQTWEGVALSASNLIVDQAKGLIGVPNLSPIGHDEVLRSYGR